MSEQREWMARNDEQRARLTRLIERLSDDDLLRAAQADGEWTVADTLVHLAFYDRRAEVLMRQFMREGVSPAPYHFQSINDALLPIARRIPPREMALEALAAAEAVDAVAAELDADLEAAIKEQGEVSPERWYHRKNHLDDLERELGAG
jgi:hypothetical protein